MALFDDFPKASGEQWRAAALDALKGQSLEALTITTAEGLSPAPIYHPEDLPEALLRAIDGALPGVAPFGRGTRPAPIPWAVAQEVGPGAVTAGNARLRADLPRGQDAVAMTLDDPTRWGLDPGAVPPEAVGRGGLSLADGPALQTLLEGIDLGATPLYCNADLGGPALGALWLAHARSHGLAWRDLKGSLGFDPLGALARDGRLPLALEAYWDQLAPLMAWYGEMAPGIRVAGVDTVRYRAAGADAVTELALALATGADYLRAAVARGVAVDTAAAQLQFSTAVGTDLFAEIAKLRAARRLWAAIVAAWGGSEAAQAMALHGVTDPFALSRLDPYVNLLRTTTGAFAAVVGGCDALTIAPFDQAEHPPVGQGGEFPRRLARNTHTILREEALLGAVLDPAGGSWYVESLTDATGRAAWAVFREIEAQGGMGRSLQGGWPQARVAAKAAERLAAVAEGRTTWVGVNRYVDLAASTAPRAGDTPAPEATAPRRVTAEVQDSLNRLATAEGRAMGEALVAAAAAGASLGALTAALGVRASPGPRVQALVPRRASEGFETLRANAAAYGRIHGQPVAVVVGVGGGAALKPRLDFAVEFLQAGGFAVGDPPIVPLDSDAEVDILAAADRAAAVALEAADFPHPPVVVLGASDTVYPALVPAFAAAFKARNPHGVLWVAGRPSALTEGAVDACIHRKSPRLDLLHTLQTRLEITAP
ncbi:MAG: acyl-CoA mutase large subunit family protein [Candidatus Competibacterales bacterium]